MPAERLPNGEWAFHWTCPKCGHAQHDSVDTELGPYLTLICGKCSADFSDSDLDPASIESWEAARVAAESA